MCGIAGIYFEGKWDQKAKTRYIRRALLSIEHRGMEATGYANIFNIQGSDYNIFKHPTKASKFCEMNEFKKEQWGDLVIMHTRYPTKGDPANNNNNHPHESANWIMIHNGWIYNRPIDGYEYKGECDSEVALSYIERNGLMEALQELQGSMAFAMLNKNDFTKLHIYVYGKPVIVQEVIESNRYALVFSSEGVDLYRGRLFSTRLPQTTLKTNTLYTIDLRNKSSERQIIEKKDRVAFVNREIPRVSVPIESRYFPNLKSGKVESENERRKRLATTSAYEELMN